MVHGRYIGQGEDITEAVKIRQEVFENSDYDTREDLDNMALTVIMDEDGVPVGTARLVLDLIEDRFYADNICVKKEYRGKKYGDFLIRMLADKAAECMATDIWSEVPESAKGFFEKEFFIEEGKTARLTIMKAELAKFRSCCSSHQCAQGQCTECGR